MKKLIPTNLPDNLPECPDEFTAEWGIKFLTALGADTSKIESDWCWREFNTHFKEYQKLFEQYLEKATTGNPAVAAHLMHKYGGISKNWAEGVIKKVKTGDPAVAAYRMHRYYKSSKNWTEGVIENATTGNPSGAAYMMHKYCESSKNWAEGVIKKLKN